MKAVGLTVDPLLFCDLLREKKIPFSVNECTAKTAVFVGTEAFNKARSRLKDNSIRMIVFDAKERLMMLQGLPILNGNLSSVWDKIKALKQVEIAFKHRNYISEYLESNKDREGGFLHIYNTNIYRILPKPSREGFREQFLGLLNGSIPRKEFEKRVKQFIPRRGRSAEAVQSLMDLTKTPAFANMQECVKQAKGIKRDKEIIELAQKYDVPAFDLRYVLSTLNKNKRMQP